MNSKDIIMFALGAISAFMLSMTIACYVMVTADLPEHHAIHTRALNYTDKDCYTKTDIELIVFGKVLDYDKK
jgi:ABC-type transport system involved in Fe-S cluster assembly fused permease/ATPase subunit